MNVEQRPGPSCSKLTMSLVNILLKFWLLNMAYTKCTLIFLLRKNVICKSYSHFFSKNTCELDIVLTRTVNILTINTLVKPTMLWTTGPWTILGSCFMICICAICACLEALFFFAWQLVELMVGVDLKVFAHLLFRLYRWIWCNGGPTFRHVSWF